MELDKQEIKQAIKTLSNEDLQEIIIEAQRQVRSPKENQWWWSWWWGWSE